MQEPRCMHGMKFADNNALVSNARVTHGRQVNACIQLPFVELEKGYNHPSARISWTPADQTLHARRNLKAARQDQWNVITFLTGRIFAQPLEALHRPGNLVVPILLFQCSRPPWPSTPRIPRPCRTS